MTFIETCFLWFFCYSAIGWIYETILCSVTQKRFINRGFFNGPYCPIYGFGALLNILLLNQVENLFLLFLAAFFLTTILEYISSWVLEKLFHARWWDYTNRKFNLNGRVFLLGGLVFALLSLLQMKFLHPLLSYYIAMIPEAIHSIVALLLFTFLLIDIVYTLTKLTELGHLLRDASLSLDNALHSVKTLVHEKVESGYHRINSQIRRMIISFPRLKSIHYNERLKMLKEFIKLKNEKDKKNE